MYIDSKNHVYSYLKKILILVILSMLFWVVAIIEYYEYQSTLKVKALVKQEQNRVEQLWGKLSTKEELAAHFDQEKIKNTMQYHDILAIEIKNGKEVLLALESKKLSEKLKYAFNENIITEIKNAVFIPMDHQEACLLFAYLHEGYAIKILVHLNANEVAGIKNKINEVIFIAIFSILITCLVSFPLIYQQYKQILGSNKKLSESNLGIIKALGNAVAKRDSDTNEHNYRVTYYAARLGLALGLLPDQMENLTKGAFLHDVGKIGIPDAVLLKPEKLTNEEFDMMKNHVVYGQEIIDGIDWLKGADLVVNYHHEKFDASGYPYKLKGEEIPIEARIFAIVDVFDALMSIRPYKQAMEYQESIKIITQLSGTHFDPNIVSAFLRIAKELHSDIDGKNSHEIEALLMPLVKNEFYPHFHAPK